MSNIAIIIFFMLLGVIMQRIKKIPEQLPTYLNNYLIYFVLPSLALRHLPEVDLEPSLLLPIASAWISFALSWLIFGTLGRKLGWGDPVTGCLIIVSGLANTSFVGFPIIGALYGAEGVKIALLIDQAGSFIIVSSIAIIVASIYASAKKRKRDISRKIITFPPFLFFMIAITLNLLDWSLPNLLDRSLAVFTVTLTPVALTAVGLQVKINPTALKSSFLWYGLGYKLVFIPLLIYFMFAKVFGLEGLMLEVSVLEAAMAPMITGSIIAITHQLEPRLASLLVGVGIPLSFLTLGVWYWAIH
jgi:malate permease and related proteins